VTGDSHCEHTHFGEAWSGSSAQHGLSIENLGSGDGIRGYASSPSSLYAGIYGHNYSTGPGVYGTSEGGGPGVAGYSTGRGVYGFGADGVVGESWSDWKSGVLGHNTGIGTGYGVTGRSDHHFGVYAWGNDDGVDDEAGDILLQGNYGEIFTEGNVLHLYSNGSVVVDLDNDNNTAGSAFSIRGGANEILWSVSEASGVIVTSGSQASAVTTAGGEQRLMYAVEGTGVWLEDLGTAMLGAGGETTIAFDPAYAGAANLGQEYQVFVSPQSDQPVLLVVSAKTAAGFTVRGVTLDGEPASCAFDFRVVAPRAGYESVRLEKFTPPAPEKEGS
jgi:hypothetical protein